MPQFQKRLWFLPALAITCAALCALITLGLRKTGFLTPVFAHGVYYSLWATLILALVAARGVMNREENREALLLLRRDWPRALLLPVGLGFTLAALIFAAVEPEFRVLADEANLLSASLSLHKDRTLFNILEADHVYGRLHPIQFAVAHRPGFFAFLTSIPHALFGFSTSHPFLVNFLACGTLLSLIIHVVGKLGDSRLAISAVFLTAAHPLFALTSASGGFDLVNLLMVVGVYLLLFRFAMKPTAEGLDLLLPVVLLASQCRYESVVLVFPVLAAMILERKRIAQWGFRPIPILCIPLAMPILWQKIISNRVANPGDSEAAAFQLSNIPANIQNALEFFLNPFAKNFPTLEIAAVVALIGLGLFLVRLKSRTDTEVGTLRRALLLVFLGHLLISLVQFAYYFGDIRRPWVMRLGMLQLPFIALGAAYTLRRLDIYVTHRAAALRPVLFAFLVLLFCVGLSRATDNERAGSLTIYRDYRNNLRFLKGRKREGSLIIAERSILYAARNRGAIGIERAKKKPIQLHNQIAGRIYDEIYIIQTCEFKTGRPLAAHNVENILKLKKLWEYSSTDKLYVRISKVESVMLSKILPPGSLKPAAGIKTRNRSKNP